MHARAVFFLLLLGLGIWGAPMRAQEETPSPSPAPEDLAAEISEKEQELEALKEKINALRASRASKEHEEQRLTTSIEILEDSIQEARLQLDSTTVSLQEVGIKIRQNTQELRRLAENEEHLRTDLLNVLRELEAYDRRSPIEVFFQGGTFSDFIRAREATESLQNRVTALLTSTRDARRAREEREQELRDRQEELDGLQKLQEAQRVALQGEEQRKRTLLSQNVAQQAKVSSLLAEAEQTRREIQQEVFTLRNAGIRLSLKEAEDFARYAGKLTGVRPALLLGVLKVESNIGNNVGSGRYPDDVHPAHREAFLRVIEKLGLDPATAPVSAKPTNYAGWGGAMGPGQIMPGTWERVEETIARLTGKKQPSPYDLGDAFVGTAVILSGGGAAGGNEYEAVNRYFAGPNWQRFTWYGDRVLAVAKEYEARGL